MPIPNGVPDITSALRHGCSAASFSGHCSHHIPHPEGPQAKFNLLLRLSPQQAPIRKSIEVYVDSPSDVDRIPRHCLAILFCTHVPGPLRRISLRRRPSRRNSASIKDSFTAPSYWLKLHPECQPRNLEHPALNALPALPKGVSSTDSPEFVYLLPLSVLIAFRGMGALAEIALYGAGTAQLYPPATHPAAPPAGSAATEK